MNGLTSSINTNCVKSFLLFSTKLEREINPTPKTMSRWKTGYLTSTIKKWGTFKKKKRNNSDCGRVKQNARSSNTSLDIISRSNLFNHTISYKDSNEKQIDIVSEMKREDCYIVTFLTELYH